MAKIRLTKGELKRQRDALKQYKRYLPILQLKKQQLQMEILRQAALLEEKKRLELEKRNSARSWAGLLAERSADIGVWIKPRDISIFPKNIAGIELEVFERAQFDRAEYDLFMTPLWMDFAVEALRLLVSVRKEIRVMEKGMAVLRHELRIATQHVNLFEKIKIPESEDAIRVIKIYIGDQMTNAVGRSKIAKRKISAELLERAPA